jgi:hypothetical protein
VGPPSVQGSFDEEQAILAPEELIADEEGRGAADADRLRLIGGLAESGLGVLFLGLPEQIVPVEAGFVDYIAEHGVVRDISIVDPEGIKNR